MSITCRISRENIPHLKFVCSIRRFKRNVLHVCWPKSPDDIQIVASDVLPCGHYLLTSQHDTATGLLSIGEASSYLCRTGQMRQMAIRQL